MEDYVPLVNSVLLLINAGITAWHHLHPSEHQGDELERRTRKRRPPRS